MSQAGKIHCIPSVKHENFVVPQILSLWLSSVLRHRTETYDWVMMVLGLPPRSNIRQTISMHVFISIHRASQQHEIMQLAGCNRFGIASSPGGWFLGKCLKLFDIGRNDGSDGWLRCKNSNDIVVFFLEKERTSCVLSKEHTTLLGAWVGVLESSPVSFVTTNFAEFLPTLFSYCNMGCFITFLSTSYFINSFCIKVFTNNKWLTNITPISNKGRTKIAKNLSKVNIFLSDKTKQKTTNFKMVLVKVLVGFVEQDTRHNHSPFPSERVSLLEPHEIFYLLDLL